MKFLHWHKWYNWQEDEVWGSIEYPQMQAPEKNNILPEKRLALAVVESFFPYQSTPFEKQEALANLDPDDFIMLEWWLNILGSSLDLLKSKISLT